MPHAPKVFIVNPVSAQGLTARRWPEIQAMAHYRLGPIVTRFTQAPGHATDLAREAAAQGARLIVCVGGDGTLNEVVNGIMAARGPGDPELLTGYIPGGTGCDLARTLNLPQSPVPILEAMAQGRSRTMDLGHLTYVGPRGGEASCYFHNVVSFGLGGEVDARVNRTTKALGGFASFIWATLISILLYGKKEITVEVDGKEPVMLRSWNVAVANGRYHGGGMHVAPEALVDDGLLDLTLIGDLSKPQVFINLPKLYNGRIYTHRKILHLRGRKVVASSPQRVLLDMDGEQPGRLPVRIRVVPGALRMAVPPES